MIERVPSTLAAGELIHGRTSFGGDAFAQEYFLHGEKQDFEVEPEVVMIDISVAQLFRQKYGILVGTGIGIIDAPIPGALSIFERTFKMSASFLAGEPSFPVGLIGGAVVFSPEQVILDLDIAEFEHNYINGIGGEQFNDSLELIREKGIGGLFIDTEHTAKNFRYTLTMTRAIKSLKSTDVKVACSNDPVELAHRKCQELLAGIEPYHIEDDKARAIDRVVEAASKELESAKGAMD